MKFFVTFSLFILLTNNIQSQVKKDSEKTKEMSQQEKGHYYMTKSKKYKKTGWILIGSGLGLWGTSLLLASNEYENGNSGMMTKTTFYLGTGSIIASFPFFLQAAKIKGKAQILLQENEIAISMDSRRNIYQRTIGVGIRIGR